MASQRDVWEHLGRTDADWAVASAPGKRHGAWATELDTFYGSGRTRVDEVCRMLPEDHGREKALDYGSGTGRLSFALAERFNSVTSADISESMIAILAARAEERGLSNISTVNLNDHPPEPGHDVAFSLITLQHFQTLMNVSSALENIARALIPGGYAIVDFPTPPLSMRRRIQPRYQAYRALSALGLPSGILDRMGMSGISMLYEAPEQFENRLRYAGLSLISREFYASEYSEMATYLTQRIDP